MTFHGHLVRRGCVYITATLSAIVAAAALANGVATLTRETLLQAVEAAKQGQREQLSKAKLALQRPERLRVPKELLPDFLALLKADDTEIQLVGALGLRILKDPKSKEALVEYLKSKDFRELDRLVHAGKINERRYTNEMQASGMAVLALGDIGDKSVIPLLESLRGVKDLKFEFGGGPVHEALAKLGTEGIEGLSKLGRDAESHDIMAAEKAIRGITDPEKVPALISTVKNEQSAESLRAAAVGALANMKEVDTLPLVLSVAADGRYPLSVRVAAARGASETGRPDVEKALLALRDDGDPVIRATVLICLGRLNPNRYLPEILARVAEKSTHEGERDKLAEGVFWSIGVEHLKAQRDLVAVGIQATRPDGSPSDHVRIFMWKAYNKATGEEPPLEVRDVKLAYDKLRGDFRQRIIRENTHASAMEVRRLVDDKIRSIIVAWPPEKEEQKQ